MNFSKISKNLIDGPFWTNFAHFRENRNFSEKKCFCPFFQLWVDISFQKKTDEHMMREKNDTDCRTDGRTECVNLQDPFGDYRDFEKHFC